MSLTDWQLITLNTKENGHFSGCRAFTEAGSRSRQPYLQGLVCVGHWQDFVPGVDAAQFAEGAEQPLTGPTVELEFLLVMLRTGQNLRKKEPRHRLI